MWRSQYLLETILRYRGKEDENFDEHEKNLHVFNPQSSTIFPLEKLNEFVDNSRKKRKIVDAPILTFKTILPERNSKQVDTFFDFVKGQRASISGITVPEFLVDKTKMQAWVNAYRGFADYHQEAITIKKHLNRVSYNDLRIGLKKVLSTFVHKMIRPCVLLFPFQHLTKSDAWFTILGMAMLEASLFEIMRNNTIDVWDILDVTNAVQKYGMNVTYLLIDDFAWSGTQASQFAVKILNEMRAVHFTHGSKLTGNVWFKAKPYAVTANSIVFVRAGVAENAIQKFHSLEDDFGAISLQYHFKLPYQPNSSLFTWCGNGLYKQSNGLSATYAYTDHKLPDYASSGVSMILSTGIVCPYMFHGVRHEENLPINRWIVQHEFDISGRVKRKELLHTWNTSNGIVSEYELHLDTGLVVFSASTELNAYKYRPFLKKGMNIRLERLTEKYVFAFSSTACVLMSKSNVAEFWSNGKIHAYYDFSPIRVKQENVSWNETLWNDPGSDKFVANPGNPNPPVYFSLDIDGDEYIGVNFVEDKVQSSYIPGVFLQSNIDLQKIDPKGVVPVTALCHLFSGDSLWGRSKSFYKQEQAQQILNKL